MLSDPIAWSVAGYVAVMVAGMIWLTRVQWRRIDRHQEARRNRRDLIMARLIFEHKSGSHL